MSLNSIPHKLQNNAQIKTYGPPNLLQREVPGNREWDRLIKAAQANDIESFRILVTHVKAINLQDPRINTLLDVIPESMEALCMELINKQDSHGNTMLHYAVINGDLALVKRLDQFGADVSLTNNFGWTAFDCAVQQKNVDLFQYLMIHQHKINFHDTNIRDIFVELACEGSKDAIEFLIDKRQSLTNLEDLECHENILKSCFLNAAIFAHPEICMLLIEFDTLNEKLINSLDHNGQSGLHLAAIYAEYEICKLILEHCNSDFNRLLNLKDYHKKTALDYALDNKNLDLFNLLVKYGAHFNRHDQRLSDLLVIAVDKYDLESLKYLTKILKISLDPQLQNRDTQDVQYVQDKLKTVFHTACSNGFDDLVLYFLNDNSIKDIVIGTIDTLGKSSLHLATIYNRKNIVKMLIPYNELLNLQDNEGNTALHYGAFRKNTFICDLLICFGADNTIKNNNDITPADLMCADFQAKIPKRLVRSRGM